MKFVQIVDYKTEQFDTMNQLMDKWVDQTKGKRTATHTLIGKDRSDDSHYVEIVEFPSYEEAMKYSICPRPTGSSRRWWRSATGCRRSPTSMWSATNS